MFPNGLKLNLAVCCRLMLLFVKCNLLCCDLVLVCSTPANEDVVLVRRNPVDSSALRPAAAVGIIVDVLL
jgi:hypothetical protein